MNIKVVGAAALVAACIAGCCKNEALLTVDGKSLTRCDLDKDVAALMEARKAQIPAEQMDEAKKMFENQLAQKFLMETRLSGALTEPLSAIVIEEAATEVAEG